MTSPAIPSEEREFLPCLPVRNPQAVDRIRRDPSHWLHTIDFGDYVREGQIPAVRWNWRLRHLCRHEALFKDREALELGPEDGLWTCWLARLGCRKIVATDLVDRRSFFNVVDAFALPVEYYPGILSTDLPQVLRRRFPVVVSMGVLYHVHDPLTTLAMYQGYVEPGGWLVLETASIVDEIPVLYYTATDLVYPGRQNNHFVPSTQFLKDALQETLGFEIVEHHDDIVATCDRLQKPQARSLVFARKVSEPKMLCFHELMSSLGMDAAPFVDTDS